MLHEGNIKIAQMNTGNPQRLMKGYKIAFSAIGQMSGC